MITHVLNSCLPLALPSLSVYTLKCLYVGGEGGRLATNFFTSEPTQNFLLASTDGMAGFLCDECSYHSFALSSLVPLVQQV